MGKNKQHITTSFLYALMSYYTATDQFFHKTEIRSMWGVDVTGYDRDTSMDVRKEMMTTVI